MKVVLTGRWDDHSPCSLALAQAQGGGGAPKRRSFVDMEVRSLADTLFSDMRHGLLVSVVNIYTLYFGETSCWTGNRGAVILVGVQSPLVFVLS